MTLLTQLSLGGQCLARAAAQIRDRVLWGPWLARLALQLGVLLLLVWAAHPAVSWFMAPVFRAVSGDDALRYPELYRRLPRLFGLAERVVFVLVTPVVAGIATRLFERRWTGRGLDAAAAWSEGLALAPALIVSALPLTLVALGLEWLLDQTGAIRLSGLTRLLIPRLLLCTRGVLEAAFAYLPALLVLERRGAGGALWALPRTWSRGLVPALLVGAVASLVALPFDLLLARGGSFLDHGAPEAIAGLLALRALARAFTGLLGSGALTLAFLSAAAPDRQDV